MCEEVKTNPSCEQGRRLKGYTGEDEETLEREGIMSGPRFGARHTLCMWASLGFIILFVQRVNMSVALVAMATQNSTQVTLTNGSECGERDVSSEHVNTTQAEFDWSNTLQGFVLSSFYYGYFVSQIPSSFVAGRIGGKLMYTIAMMGCSVLTLLIPVCARYHVAMLMVNRVIQGALQGIVLPSMQVTLSKWVPSRERSRLVAFTYAGCQVGTVIGTLSAGYICDTSFGWPLVFYSGGGFGIVWCLAWTCLIYDSPSDHPRITVQERIYIEKNVNRSQKRTPKIPWRSIATSPALYAIAAAHMANDWGYFAVMTCLPKFMKDILNYDLSKNGLLSSLPYAVMWICNLVAGTLADWLRKPNRLTTASVRKLMISIGLIGPASLLITAAYLPGCSQPPMVALLTLAMGLSGFTMAGHCVNHLDIAPAFAGLLFSMTNTFGTTTGFIGPAVAAALTDHHDTRGRWQTFFLISGAIDALGGTLFVLFARGEVQPWAIAKDDEMESIIPTPSSGYGSTQAVDDLSDDDTDRGS